MGVEMLYTLALAVWSDTSAKLIHFALRRIEPAGRLCAWTPRTQRPHGRMGSRRVRARRSRYARPCPEYVRLHRFGIDAANRVRGSGVAVVAAYPFAGLACLRGSVRGLCLLLQTDRPAVRLGSRGRDGVGEQGRAENIKPRRTRRTRRRTTQRTEGEQWQCLLHASTPSCLHCGISLLAHCAARAGRWSVAGAALAGAGVGADGRSHLSVSGAGVSHAGLERGAWRCLRRFHALLQLGGRANGLGIGAS